MTASEGYDARHLTFCYFLFIFSYTFVFEYPFPLNYLHYSIVSLEVSINIHPRYNDFNIPYYPDDCVAFRISVQRGGNPVPDARIRQPM